MSNSRRRKDDEPELQWLEDLIGGLLCWLCQAVVGVFDKCVHAFSAAKPKPEDREGDRPQR